MSEITENTEAERSQTAVVHVKFKTGSRISLLQIDDIDAKAGSCVVAESDIGLTLATILTPKEIIEKTKEPLKKVIRIATEEDIRTDESNRPFESDAKNYCVSKAKEYKLQMKVVKTESTLDRKKLIFYFTADNRVDFRELVRDLASKFKTRIEMRQIGVRDEVKLIGGIGVCGSETCCSRFLTHFEPISIRMAKKQELSINQGKLSGICGRLMCCLNYEIDESARKKKKARFEDDKMDSYVVEHAVETEAESIDSALETGVVIQEETAEEPASEEAKTVEETTVIKAPEKTSQPEPPREGGITETADDKQKKPGRFSNKRRKFWKKKKKMHDKGANDKPPANE
ncbi:MAG: stage 0 sporulation protein [Nitrospirae bacterium]|nr:stage 0 sporulation protein [Nitrospirota bacterium]